VFYVWVNEAITAPEPTAMQFWGDSQMKRKKDARRKKKQ